MAEIHAWDRDPAHSGADGPLADANRAYLQEAMRSGEFVAYLAESGGVIVATSGLTLYRTAPHPGNLAGVNAYILNMYTVPDRRGEGLASALLQRLIEHARESVPTRVSLRATDAGRAVYERFGFGADPGYMQLRIAGDPSPE